MLMWSVLFLAFLLLVPLVVATATAQQPASAAGGLPHPDDWDLPLSSCCALLAKPVALAACVNTSNAASLSQRLRNAAPYTAGGPRAQLKQGPALAVTIVSRATKEVYSWAAHALLIQAAYAQAHGYAALPLYADERYALTYGGDYTYHRKLSLVLATLEGGVLAATAASDYVVWWDADAAPLHLHRRVEALAAGYPEAHVLLSADAAAAANTGVFVVRNTLWARRFLRHWLSLHTSHDTDQHGFSAACRQWAAEGEPVGTRVRLLPTWELNSEAPALSMQQPGHPVLHLAAESAAFRGAVLLQGARTVCAAMPASSAAAAAATSDGAGAAGAGEGEGERAWLARLPPQLSLTQPRLLAIARDVYRAESRRRLQALQRLTAGGGVAMARARVVDLGGLRAAAAKWAYVLTHYPPQQAEAAAAAVEASTAATATGADADAGMPYGGGVLGENTASLHVRRAALAAVRAFVGHQQAVVQYHQAQRARGGDRGQQGGEGMAPAAEWDLSADVLAAYSACEQENTATPPPGSAAARAAAAAAADEAAGDEEEEGGERDPTGTFEFTPGLGGTSTSRRLARDQRRLARAAAAQYDPEKGGAEGGALTYCVRSRFEGAQQALPDRLKTAVELAFDLLTALGDYPGGTAGAAAEGGQEAEEVGAYLLRTVDDLLAMVHPSQRALVQEMKAGLYSELGERQLQAAAEDGGGLQLAAALQHLHTSLAVFEKLHSVGHADLRAYSHTRALQGAALCQTRQYKQGMRAFEAALDMARGHLRDPLHPQLIPKYYNAAMCMWQARHKEGVAALLGQVVSAYERAGAGASAFRLYYEQALQRLREA